MYESMCINELLYITYHMNYIYKAKFIHIYIAKLKENH